VDTKVELLPHYPAFLIRRIGMNPGHLRDGEVHTREADELFDKVVWTIPQVVTKISGISEVAMCRLLFGGWSNSQNFMRPGCVFSDEGAALNQETQGSSALR
jgi:hypothetical protein